MKKLIALLLAACLMLGLMTTAFAADEKSNDIVILYTNDVHCAVDDNIGYAGLAAYKKEMQAAYNYVALVDCGDSVQGGASACAFVPALRLAYQRNARLVRLRGGRDRSFVYRHPAAHVVPPSQSCHFCAG